MNLFATVKPTEALLQMYNELGPFPGDWVHQVCGDSITGVRRAEYNEPDCNWKTCIFVPANFFILDCNCRETVLFSKLRTEHRIVVPGEEEVYMLVHGGVLGVCTR